MVTLRERLTEVFNKKLQEAHENSSKEMIASNTASFDEMGMANTAPGEFAQEEITDHANLENTASMANDNEFSGKENGGCENCGDVVDKIDDAMDSLASDIVDISVKDEPVCDGDDECEDEEEKKLMALAAESVKGSLKGVFQSLLKEGRFNEEAFVVYFWPFAGYQTYPVKVEAYSEEEALEKAVAELEKEGKVAFFADDVEDAEEHPDLYMYVDATTEGASQPHYIDAQNLRITKDDSVKESAMRRVVKKLQESDYAGPLSFVPDTRFNVSDVLNALKAKIGEGSEGIHVDQDLDEEGNKVYVVTQVDEEKLPASLEVVNVTLKKEGNKYKVAGTAKDFPAMK